MGVLVRDHERHVLAAMVMRTMTLPWGVHSCLSAVIQTIQFSLDMGFYEEAPLELEIQGVL